MWFNTFISFITRRRYDVSKLWSNNTVDDVFSSDDCVGSRTFCALPIASSRRTHPADGSTWVTFSFSAIICAVFPRLINDVLTYSGKTKSALRAHNYCFPHVDELLSMILMNFLDGKSIWKQLIMSSTMIQQLISICYYNRN